MTHERIEAIPFQPPSLELLELLREMERYRHELNTLCAFEWNSAELYGFGELTPGQVDRLLAR